MHFDFELYKNILEDEVKAFNNICTDIASEIECNSKIIEEHHQALRHRIDNEENKRILGIHMFKKYNIGFVDINEMIMKENNRSRYLEPYFQDKYVIEKLHAISNFNTNCEEIDKMKVKNSQLKIILAKVHHLTAEHFAYSSLEALKNTIQPEIRYSRLESYSNIVPESLYIHNVYTFPHNTETDAKFIDEKLVNLFEDIFQCEILRAHTPELSQRKYITSAYKLF